MTLGVADYVNDVPPVAKVGDISNYLSPAVSTNAIDTFRLSVRETLAYGTSARLLENDFIGRLLALRLVSAAEAYFRRILSDTLMICPMARSAGSEKQINLGGLLWHGKERYSLSAFDHISFSSSKELKSGAQGYVGFIMQDASFQSLLKEYDKVCQIRHSIIHADGVVPGRNAVQLDIPHSGGQVELVVRFNELHEMASVITTLVVTFNRELFDHMCHRWAIGWRKLPGWSPSDEQKEFSRLWDAFFSKEDHKVRSGRTKITKSSCMAAVRTQYSL